MAFGCLRYAHTARSEPRRLTAALLHCRCPKGKHKHARDGFDFAVLEAHRTLAPARQRVAGLCFSDEGRPWTILEVQETMQSEMAVFLDNPEEITTHSWRCMAPTLAQLECRPEEMAALGDWQNKSDQPDVSDGLPLLVSEVRSLHQDQVFGMGSRVQADGPTLLGGDQEELDKARSHGLAEADRLLCQDRQPIWASSQKFQDVRKRLKLSQQFMEAAGRAGKRRGRRITADARPAQWQGADGYLAGPSALSSRQVSARTQQMSAPLECTYVPFCRSLAHLAEESMELESATSSGQSWRLHQYQLLPNHRTVYQEENSSRTCRRGHR